MIISVTERGTFRRCRRRWNYSSKSRGNLEPIINAPQLMLGWLIHKTLEEWSYGIPYEPEKPDSEIYYLKAEELDDRYMRLAAQKIDEAKLAYKEKIGAFPSMDELAPAYEQLEIGQAMIKNYVKQWGQPLPKGYRLIQMEQTCLVDIPGALQNYYCPNCKKRWLNHTPENPALAVCECGQLGWLEHGQLEATLDGLLADQRDRLFILERKTYKQRPRIDHLTMNDQFTTYGWVLRQLGLGQVGGVLYDGLWKRIAPTKAHPKFEELFFRHTILVSKEQMDDLEKHLREEYNDMLLCSLGLSGVYPNRRWEGCFDCPFDRLCEAETRGEDYDYIADTYYRQRPHDSWSSYKEDE